MYGVTKAEATRQAKECLSKIKYQGFKVRTWDNGGWCWEVTNGQVSVYGSNISGEVAGYWAMLKNHCVNIKTASGNYKDPNKAIDAQVKLAQEHVDQIMKAVHSIKWA